MSVIINQFESIKKFIDKVDRRAQIKRERKEMARRAKL
jgi:hypothetical protein